MRQVEIIHLSDIHFGSHHRFVPPRTPDGDRGSTEGYPKLLEKLLEDLNEPDPGCPVIICITGDLTTRAAFQEFEEAEEFVKQLSAATVLGRKQSKTSIFVVPGNHDVNYVTKNMGERWQQWTDFYNRLFGTTYKREEPWCFAEVHNFADDLGLIVLSLNSCIEVEKDTPDERRGQLDFRQLAKIKEQLQSIAEPALESAIRIALIHHHPVLIPALVEGERGYDAVLRSDKLLSILHEFGFHLLLHGHKHYPVTFLERVNSAFLDVDDQPMMIVAGGSTGSTELPDHPKKTNCYNRITVKWHSNAGQARIRVRTRGLQLYEGPKEKLPTEWGWTQLKEEDRSFYKNHPMPSPKSTTFVPFDKASSNQDDDSRIKEYQRTRGNMAVVEVMPSLDPKQAYEARFWIVGHKREDKDIPEEVSWSAGHMFPILTIKRDDDANFCGIFDYWGPMLLQAHMKFSNGDSIVAHIYARMPKTYDANVSEEDI